jgi:hypothetical protein
LFNFFSGKLLQNQRLFQKTLQMQKKTFFFYLTQNKREHQQPLFQCFFGTLKLLLKKHLAFLLFSGKKGKNFFCCHRQLQQAKKEFFA